MQRIYIVERMDIVSRKKFPLSELFRLTLCEGKLILDKNNTLPGRGVYVYKDIETLEELKKRNLLSRYGKEDYRALMEEMEHDLGRKEEQA